MRKLLKVDYDVIVVGAGPSGSTAAARLAAAGLSVLILERYPLPRYKTCGGGITRRALQKMPIDISSVVRESIDTVVAQNDGEKTQIFTHKRPFMFLVMRDELDFLLTQHAVNCGANLQTDESVIDVTTEEDIIYVATRTKRFSCRFLLGADGVNSLVARKTDLSLGKQKILALEYEVKRAPTFVEKHSHSILIDYGAVPHGYLWVFPKRDHFSIGVGSFTPNTADLQRCLKVFLSSHDLLKDVLQARGHHLSFGGAPLQIARGGVALIGDAAGLVEPFGGEGIYYALYSGELAAAQVIKQTQNGTYDMQSYQDEVDRLIMPELSLLSKVNGVFYGNINFIHSLITRYPQFMYKGLEILEGEKSYSKVYPVLNRVLHVSRGIHSISHYFG